MIECRQQNTPLYIGALVAMMLHILVGFPMLTASWGVGGKSPLDSALDGKSASERRQRERLEMALREHELSTQDDKVVPGLEDGSDQGMTWIGYDEYQEHLAQHAEVDQAAFTEKDAAGGGALAAGELNPTPKQQSTQALAQPPAQPTAPPTAQPTAQPPAPTPTTEQPPPTPAVEAVSAASPAATTTPSDFKGVNSQPTPTSDLPTAPVAPDGVLPVAIDRPDVQPDPSKTPAPTAEIKPSATPSPVARDAIPPGPQSSPPTETAAAAGATSPVVAPVPGPPGVPGASQVQGEKSDRESDATSIVDVPPSMWRNGKPLARKGLEIKTRKPDLPILTRLTTSPGNPICEILFGRDGVPVTCTILASSGYPDIDGPVLDALYRWRAKGSQLAALQPGKTLKFRVRFILN